jgi:adenylate cyclase
MYVMASFAAAHLLEPLGAINRTLQAISMGKLESSLGFRRKDEIGQLAESINMMLDGFKRRLRLGKFVSTTLEQSLDDNAGLDASKIARAIKGTVLFSDIRNFTTLSESNPPEFIADMLNSHLETMSSIIQSFNGQVEQFIGDAIVAFFPDQLSEDSRKRAVEAATAMYAAHQAVIRQREDAGQIVYNFGIGLEYGQIVAGPLITPSRSEFCIIGKARSDAEQYEQLSKNGRHTRIVLSAGFLAAAELSDICCKPLAGTGLFEVTTGEPVS